MNTNQPATETSEIQTPPCGTPGQKSGVVAIVGRANVGKSTLINALQQEKVSIVSPIAQTTRNLIRSFITEPRGQIVLLDTPGVHKARNDLGKLMNKVARDAVESVDLILFTLDASSPPEEEDGGWMRRLCRTHSNLIIFLNKSDLLPSHAADYQRIWAEIQTEKQVQRPAIWLSGSATTGNGLPELLTAMFAAMPEGPILFPEDMLTDYPRKLAMADMIREQLFMRLHDEIPHDLSVVVEKLDETAADGSWTVEASIYVRRATQKGIVIGHKGRLLRAVRRAAEAEMTTAYEHPVTLGLWIKVDAHWTRNFWILQQLGYHAKKQ